MSFKAGSYMTRSPFIYIPEPVVSPPHTTHFEVLYIPPLVHTRYPGSSQTMAGATNMVEREGTQSTDHAEIEIHLGMPTPKTGKVEEEF